MLSGLAPTDIGIGWLNVHSESEGSCGQASEMGAVKDDPGGFGASANWYAPVCPGVTVWLEVVDVRAKSAGGTVTVIDKL